MAILGCGLIFRTAPIDLGERIAFPVDGLVQAHRDLTRSIPAVGEVAILSTCNRTELYCSADLDDQEVLLDSLPHYRQMPSAGIRQATSTRWGPGAQRHTIRAAPRL